MDAEAIERLLREHLEAARPPVAAAYLFGSVARGTAGPASDVDVAVLFASPPAPELSAQPFALEDELTSRLGRPVQVVSLHSAPVDLVMRVLRDGRLVVDRDPSKRIAFEVRARNEFFDLKPFLDRYRRTA